MPRQFNPSDFLQMIKMGKNPEQLMLSFLEQQSKSNPTMSNLLSMARNGDTAGLEQFARNLWASQGKDFDKEFNAFKQKFGIK